MGARPTFSGRRADIYVKQRVVVSKYLFWSNFVLVNAACASSPSKAACQLHQQCRVKALWPGAPLVCNCLQQFKQELPARPLSLASAPDLSKSWCDGLDYGNLSKQCQPLLALVHKVFKVQANSYVSSSSKVWRRKASPVNPLPLDVAQKSADILH